MASVYLFGYLEHDYLGRVMVASENLTVGSLAGQLLAWSVDDVGAPVVVTNEAGNELDLQASISTAQLRSGDIFTVRRRV
jgi:hypothetical protein